MIHRAIPVLMYIPVLPVISVITNLLVISVLQVILVLPVTLVKYVKPVLHCICDTSDTSTTVPLPYSTDVWATSDTSQ